MTLPDILRLVIGVLDDTSAPYMLTGSLAAAFYATPRATQDIDLVLEASGAQLDEIATRLESAGLYVSRDAIREALEYEGQFNAIDPRTGWKVDFILRKSREFSESEFERRRAAQVLGLEVVMASPEDLVIAKLEWAKKGGSELQLRDVASVVRANRNSLDEAYLLNWIRELGLEEQWEVVLTSVDGSDERPSA